MVNHIEKMWLEYARMVLVGSFTEEELEDVKQVFFTGASAVFAVLLSTDMNDEKKSKLAQEMHEELRDWATKTALEIAETGDPRGH